VKFSRVEHDPEVQPEGQPSIIHDVMPDRISLRSKERILYSMLRVVILPSLQVDMTLVAAELYSVAIDLGPTPDTIFANCCQSKLGRMLRSMMRKTHLRLF